MGCSSFLMITVCDTLREITELKMNMQRANRFLAEAAMLFTGRCLHSGRGTQTPILFVIIQGEKNHMANLLWDHRSQLAAKEVGAKLKGEKKRWESDCRSVLVLQTCFFFINTWRGRFVHSRTIFMQSPSVWPCLLNYHKTEILVALYNEK